MPPSRKFQREDILDTTYQIVKTEGIKSVNTRRIAKELNCSVQPIFHNFRDMEELKSMVYEKIYETYKEFTLSKMQTTDKPYKAIGIAYIQFAKIYPEFFKILFMQQTNTKSDKFVGEDVIGKAVIESGQKTFGLSYEEQKLFHVKVGIFTHGMATLVATKTVDFTEEEIDKLLEDTVRQMVIGYKKEKGEKKA